MSGSAGAVFCLSRKSKTRATGLGSHLGQVACARSHSRVSFEFTALEAGALYFPPSAARRRAFGMRSQERFPAKRMPVGATKTRRTENLAARYDSIGTVKPLAWLIPQSIEPAGKQRGHRQH